MSLYAGIDLHSTSMLVGVMREDFKRVREQKVPNDLGAALRCLEPYRADLAGIAVEATYNWYWLVDGLMEHGYPNVRLANPSAMKQYEGLKYTDDRHDAFWLAKMQVLGILPEGYIYPKQDRPMRDLLRKRSFLVRQGTSLKLNLRSMIEREKGVRMTCRQIERLTGQEIDTLLGEPFAGISAECSRAVMEQISQRIGQIEKAVREELKLRKPFQLLLSVPGIGEILAMTIMLEVGQIGRFATAGDFSSYCRLVPTGRITAGKSKGKGNRKNGNPYLSWAFSEASHHARRYSQGINRYYQRKLRERNVAVAHAAVANKLARACYYMMRDQVPFREEAMWT